MGACVRFISNQASIPSKSWLTVEQINPIYFNDSISRVSLSQGPGVSKIIKTKPISACHLEAVIIEVLSLESRDANFSIKQKKISGISTKKRGTGKAQEHPLRCRGGGRVVKTRAIWQRGQIQESDGLVGLLRKAHRVLHKCKTRRITSVRCRTEIK